MGRRKKTDIASVNNDVTAWNTAIYARLSVENSGKDDNGESIEGQISICEDYINEHPYLNHTDTYVDNGYTGTNTDRPQFKRLLEDIRQGKIKALVIKDFSRFSRDYIEAGNLLESIFPAMGVRFISVVDRYDSFETDGSAESLLIPLKNLINSYYSKDISKKVSTAVHAKQNAGEYIPSMIPYGYIKSKAQKYSYDADPETAPVVQRIFKEVLDGKSCTDIAKTLNDEGIPSPGRLRYLRQQNSKPEYANSIWLMRTIKDILKNPTYCGDLVFGRRVKALYLGQPNDRAVHDENEWRVLHDTHPALIDRASFEKVKAKLDKSSAEYDKKVKASEKFRETHQPIFSNVYCGSCNAKLRFHRYTRKKKYAAIYFCPGRASERCNAKHGIREDVLYGIVSTVLSEHIKMLANITDAIEKKKGTGYVSSRQKELDREICDITARLEKRKRNKEMLYEDYTSGILTAEDYIYHKQRFDDDYSELSLRLNDLQCEKQKLSRSLSANNRWLKNIQALIKSKKLDREIADAFTERIIIHNDNGIRVEVVLKYKDEFEMLMKTINEMEGKE